MKYAFIFLSLLFTVPAWAKPSLSVAPRTVRQGDAVLVKVTGPGDEPKGKLGDVSLTFYKVKGGWQAVAAVPLETAPGKLQATAGDGLKATVTVKERKLPEATVVVEEEYANPPADARSRITADNDAIVGAFKKNDGPPRFTGAFKPPARGKRTSLFGEWRTFIAGDPAQQVQPSKTKTPPAAPDDAHRSQHLGLDIAAKEGAAIGAVNDGVVVLVTDGYLTGKTVVVAHGAGIYSAYFHLLDATVAEEQEVKRGAPVGHVGLTGRTTGPHIHVSTWVAGGYCDPASLFNLKVGPIVRD